MLRNDENKRSPSCRTKEHTKIKMHLGRGTFCCSTLNPCCRQLSKWVPKTSKGCPWVGQNEMNKVQKWGKLKETKSVTHSCIRICLPEWFWESMVFIVQSHNHNIWIQKSTRFRFSNESFDITSHCCIQLGKGVSNSWGPIEPWEF
jgi:hypothetical protein